MLDHLRSAIEDARSAAPEDRGAKPTINRENENAGSVMPAQVLGIEELEALAGVARAKGHQRGYELAQRHMARRHQSELAITARRAETLGALGGLATSAAALRRRREGLKDAEGMELVVGTLSSAIDELENLFDALNEVGMHGERSAPCAQAGEARTFMTSRSEG